MQLLLDIHLLKPDLYAYSIHTDAPPGTRSHNHYESAFDSLESCLSDAGESLGHYFPRVQVHFEGRGLGVCSTESLRQRPRALAQRVGWRIRALCLRAGGLKALRATHDA